MTKEERNLAITVLVHYLKNCEELSYKEGKIIEKIIEKLSNEE